MIVAVRVSGDRSARPAGGDAVGVALDRLERRRERHRLVGRAARSPARQRPAWSRRDAIGEADVRADRRVVVQVRDVHRHARRDARPGSDRRAVDRAGERAESASSSACWRLTGSQAALPRIARAVAEGEPDEHLNVRIVPRDRQRLLRVRGLLGVRHAVRIAGLRLVAVLRDPDRHGAMEPLRQVLLELRHRRERHVRIPHLLRRRQVLRRRVRVVRPRVEAEACRLCNQPREVAGATDALAVVSGLSRPRAEVSPIATWAAGFPALIPAYAAL